MVKFRRILFLCFVLYSLGSAQEVRLIATTPGNTFRLGDWIDVRIEGQFHAPIDTIAPVVKDSIGPFEVVKVERKGTDPLWVIRISTIDSGKVFFPPIEFQYKIQKDTAVRKAFTNSLLFTISGVAINPKGEIKDIKPPIDAPWLFEDYVPYLIACIVLILLGGGYYYYWRKKKLQKDLLADVKVIIPPHREALTALRILEEKKLWQQGLVKEYYSEVTEIIRRFFERRWEIIALELTTAEILVQMKHIPEALHIWREMESFFLMADLVKFAKYQPTPEDHENEMRSAYEIVRAMVPKAPEVTKPQQQEAIADVR
jgi:hypothetical protein